MKRKLSNNGLFYSLEFLYLRLNLNSKDFDSQGKKKKVKDSKTYSQQRGIHFLNGKMSNITALVFVT